MCVWGVKGEQITADCNKEFKERVFYSNASTYFSVIVRKPFHYRSALKVRWAKWRVCACAVRLCSDYSWSCFGKLLGARPPVSALKWRKTSRQHRQLLGDNSRTIRAFTSVSKTALVSNNTRKSRQICR